MKASLCMALLSAGLFSAQVTFAQSSTTPVRETPTASSTPTCSAALNVTCLTKQLSLTTAQVTKVSSIDKEYQAQCSRLTSTKPTATTTQQMADFLKKRDAELKAALTPEQGGKLESALRACAPTTTTSKPIGVAPTTK